jgi:hypothetical protein
MNKLCTAFESLKNTPSDINEHMDVLASLSSHCNTVVELGVRSGVSTHALLNGKPKILQSFDINHIGSLEQVLLEYAIENNIIWKFYHENCLLTNNIHECDMLFIDTFHAFKQISCELFLHGNKSKKYIVFHDSVTFGYLDELGSISTNLFSEYLKNYYDSLLNKQGIMPAIEDFVSHNSNWAVCDHYLNNNGLLVLKNENFTY